MIKSYFKQLSKLPNSPTLFSTFYAINIYRWLFIGDFYIFYFLITYFKLVILKNVISYCCQTQQRTLFIISVLHVSYFQTNDQHVPWPELGINTFFELLSHLGVKKHPAELIWQVSPLSMHKKSLKNRGPLDPQSRFPECGDKEKDDDRLSLKEILAKYHCKTARKIISYTSLVYRCH